MKRRSVVTVIVTRNRLEHLKLAYARISAQDVDGIVIVDNHSCDGTEAWLRSLNNPDLLVTRTDENLGGAGGFSIGFELAAERFNPGWILCFDDDAYPFDNALDLFMGMDIDPCTGGVAAAVFHPDGKICQMNRPFLNPFSDLPRFLPSMLRGRKDYHIEDSAYFSPGRVGVDASSFVGFFVRAGLVRSELGIPRKELFLYADDLIYTSRLRRLGHGLVFCPEIRFFHDCCNADEKKRAGGEPSMPLWKMYLLIRNNIELLRDQAGALFLPAVFLKSASFIKKIRLYESRAFFLRIFLIALYDGIRRDFSKKYEEIRLMTHD